MISYYLQANPKSPHRRRRQTALRHLKTSKAEFGRLHRGAQLCTPTLRRAPPGGRGTPRKVEEIVVALRAT